MLHCLLFFSNLSKIPQLKNSIKNVLLGIKIHSKKKLMGRKTQIRIMTTKLTNAKFFEKVMNREAVIRILDKISQDSKRITYSIVFINLDDFKQVNSFLGYSAGDLVLQKISFRIDMHIHPKDSFLYLGGDEFVLIIQQKLERKELLAYIEDIKACILQPMRIEDERIAITASFGVAVNSDIVTSAEDILGFSDIAMHYAKKKGKNKICVFTEKMKESFYREKNIKRNLLQAIEKEELSIAFQPQIELIPKRLRGFEALIRWNSPVLGVVSPTEFIPIAEEMKLIIPIGQWILENAMLQFKKMQRDRNLEVILSVNLSIIQIMDSHFLEMIKHALQIADFNPRNLELEITESVFINSMEYLTSVIAELKKMGIKVALDDFGTGYSSLSYLQRLPIDTLKIDKSFISDINHTVKNKQIVGTIISWVHKMDMYVVAEGVEDEIQLQYLKKQNCDCIQGYLYGKPMTMEELYANPAYTNQI